MGVECKDLSGSATATPKHTATPLTYKCEFEKAGAFALGSGTAVKGPGTQPNNTATATRPAPAADLRPLVPRPSVRLPPCLSPWLSPLLSPLSLPSSSKRETLYVMV